MNIQMKPSMFDDLVFLPKKLYKFRTWSDTNHRDMICKQIVFMAPPSSFEDKKDCILYKRYDLLIYQDVFLKYLEISIRKHPHWFFKQHLEYAQEWSFKSPMWDKEYVDKVQDNTNKKFDERFGVLSLTESPDNIDLWEKYSESHKGFCVGFNGKEMLRFLGGGGEVKYCDKLPDILWNDSFENEFVKQIFHKEKRWEIEKEYRAHKIYEQIATIEDRKIKLPKYCFTEIIFGANISEIDKKEIIQVCFKEGLNVDFYCSMIKENQIVIEKYNGVNLLSSAEVPSPR